MHQKTCLKVTPHVSQVSSHCCVVYGPAPFTGSGPPRRVTVNLGIFWAPLGTFQLLTGPEKINLLHVLVSTESEIDGEFRCHLAVKVPDLARG
jgi:hypothetical protein